jgi:hypothetical protein
MDEDELTHIRNITRLHDTLHDAERGNTTCADCGARCPTWAAVNRGVFVCAQCAGCHRNGISFVQHCYYDRKSWTADNVALMEANGNAKSNQALQDCGCCDGLTPISPESPFEEREAFIRTKYSAPPLISNRKHVAVAAGGQCRDVGLLHVTVVQANDLENKDLLGSSDPYVEVMLGDATRKTAIIDNCLNPEWHQSLTPFKWNGTDTLIVTVWDADFAKADDFNGQCLISLDRIPDDEEQTVTVPLRGVNSGTITLKLHYVDASLW